MAIFSAFLFTFRTIRISSERDSIVIDGILVLRLWSSIKPNIWSWALLIADLKVRLSADGSLDNQTTQFSGLDWLDFLRKPNNGRGDRQATATVVLFVMITKQYWLLTLIVLMAKRMPQLQKQAPKWRVSVDVTAKTFYVALLPLRNSNQELISWEMKLETLNWRWECNFGL